MELKLGRQTILDPDAIEYQWIRTLSSEGSSVEMINASIQRCLGGDLCTADLLRKVALKQSSVTELLKQLNT